MLQIEKRETESVFRFLIWCFDIVCVPTFAVGIPYFRPWRNVGASNFVLSASHITLRVMRGQALSRSYGRFFAEFLGTHSLVRLGLLDLITCVGLRYGSTVHIFREFSWKRALRDLCTSRK